MEKVFEIYIRTTPSRLWQAITDPEQRASTTSARGQFSDWKPGSAYSMSAGGGNVALGEGEVLEADPPPASGADACARSGATR